MSSSSSSNSDIAPLSVGLATAAKMLGVSERHLWQQAKDGVIPSVRTGRRIIFVVDQLKKWLEEKALASQSSRGQAAHETIVVNPAG